MRGRYLAICQTNTRHNWVCIKDGPASWGMGRSGRRRFRDVQGNPLAARCDPCDPPPKRYCTCDDETPEITTRSIVAQFFVSLFTLEIWLCHFRVPRAATLLCGLGAFLKFGAAGAGVFALTLALYAGMVASSGDFAPGKYQRVLREGIAD